MMPKPVAMAADRLLVLLLGLAAALPFVNYHARLVLEPDFPLDTIGLYLQTIRDWSWGSLPAPSAGVYFDGHSMIYAAATYVYEAVAGLLGRTPSFVHSAVVSVGLVNAAAHVLATLVFFSTARLLTGERLVALCVTVLFAISPQFLAIGLERVDRLMILPLIVVLHAGVVILRGGGGLRLGAMVGVAMAVLAATKISGFLFAVIPGSALLIAFAGRGVWKAGAWRPIAWRAGGTLVGALVVGGPVFAVLMLRQILYYGGFVERLKAGYGMQMMWTAVLPSTPRFYYNVDLFAGYGQFFLFLSLVAFIVVVIHGFRNRDVCCQWLSFNVILFSALGVAAFKYDRGGYHLVPLYLYALAIAGGLARRVPHRLPFRGGIPGRVAAALPVLCLLVPVAVVAGRYADAAAVAWGRPEAIERTRFEPRDWLLRHFAAGSRICMLGGSEWTGPPLKDAGMRVVTAPFDFPYLDVGAMGNFVTPRPYQIRSACDAMVFSDFHKRLYLDFLRMQGHEARAAEWETLYLAMSDAYPPVVFASDHPAYYVSKIEIHDLRGPPSTKAAQSEWEMADPKLSSGAEVRIGEAALTVGGAEFPLRRDRFAGSIDSAVLGSAVSGVAKGAAVSVQGWAVDLERQEMASWLLLVRGSRLLAAGRAEMIRRPDVAAHFTRLDLQLAGFRGCLFPVDGWAGGQADGDPIRFFVLEHDGAAAEIPLPPLRESGAGDPGICH